MEDRYSNVTNSFVNRSLFNYTDYRDYQDGDDFAIILEQYRASLLTVKDTTTIILLALYIPILLVSVVGNILVLIVIVPNKQLQSVTNNFLLNLALADLLVAIICIPMTAAQEVYKLWIYGEILCRATPYLQGIAVSASTFTISAMSLDRCLAIRHPVSFRRLRTTKSVRILIFFVWVTSLIIMIPILLVRRTVTDEILPGEFFTYCIERWPTHRHRQSFDMFILLIVYIFPGLLIAVCYITMSQRLWIPDKQLGDISNKASFPDGRQNHITSGRRRLAKMCISVAVMFAVCWLPYYIVNTYLSFKRDVKVANVVHFMLLIGHLHSATNPILYCFLHKTFRHYLKRFLASGFKFKVGENSKLLSKGVLSQRGLSTKSFKASYKSSFRSSHYNACAKHQFASNATPPGKNVDKKTTDNHRFHHSFISATHDSSTSEPAIQKSDAMSMTEVTKQKAGRHVSLSINGKLYETKHNSDDDSSICNS